MTIRSRLVVGVLAVAVVLVVPFLLALYELNNMHRTTGRLKDNEFTASLLIGRVRSATEDLRRAELRMTFDTIPGGSDSLSVVYERMRAVVDSISTRLPEHTSRLDSATTVLGSLVAEYLRVSGARTPDAEVTADSVFQLHMRPTIREVEAALPALENILDAQTATYLDNATAAAESSRRWGVTGLVIAGLLSALIAIWLARSIGVPVSDLDRAMRTVASGDFSYRLDAKSGHADEFERLSRSYRTMVRQLAELDKLKAEFVSIASHELKTPINVVMGYLQLLDEGVYGPLTPKQQEICRLLESQSQSLARLVHQLLDVSRFEAGGGRLEIRTVDLSRFMQELESSFTVLAEQRGINFTVYRSDDLPEQVSWDEDRISEVIGNILSNAFKFTPRGGTVEMAVGSMESAVQITVRDTGSGIAPEHLPRVFEKFYQALSNDGESRSGTGLGLAIARGIVEEHSGSISVDSELGVGTTFIVTLPSVAVPRSALAGSDNRRSVVEVGAS